MHPLLLTSYFLLPTSYFLLLTSYFLLLTSYFLLPTCTHFTFTFSQKSPKSNRSEEDLIGYPSNFSLFFHSLHFLHFSLFTLHAFNSVQNLTGQKKTWYVILHSSLSSHSLFSPPSNFDRPSGYWPSLKNPCKNPAGLYPNFTFFTFFTFYFSFTLTIRFSSFALGRCYVMNHVSTIK
jgi:hypothetical protein